jgi:hypothetical protein
MRIVRAGSAITDTDENPQEAPDSVGARGALTDEVLDNIIRDNERVRAAFTSPDGLTRISGEEERHVTFTVVMVVTDHRILFVAGDPTGGDLGQEAGTLTYDNLAAVAIEGTDPAILALSMANGVRWEFPLPDVDPEIVGAVVRHLRWVGEVRSRLVACKNDIQMAVGEIRECTDGMEWEAAIDIYEAQRDHLDELIGAVHWTEPIDDEVIAPELTEMERTLERSYARLFVERANSQLELGQQLVENEDYNQARKVLQSAQNHYESASERTEAIERGDAFRFGEQRELRDELDQLEWEIESVAAEPIRRAHEAKIRASSEQDLAVAIEHWETAFRRYGSVLTLDWGDDGRNFAGDQKDVREEMETAAENLVEGYRELAREKWNEGVTLERNSAVKSALRACTTARDHLDRALELAEEFRPEEAAVIEQRREKMAEALREMRDTATVERTPTTAEGDDGDQTESSVTGGAEGIEEMDTHQEITFDATVDQGAADGGRHHERGFTATDGERATDGVDAEEDVTNEDDPESKAEHEKSLYGE